MLPAFVGLVIRRRPIVGDNLEDEQLDCLFFGLFERKPGRNKTAILVVGKAVAASVNT